MLLNDMPEAELSRGRIVRVPNSPVTVSDDVDSVVTGDVEFVENPRRVLCQYLRSVAARGVSDSRHLLTALKACHIKLLS